jgi:putative ABC transport system permease protein
MRIPLLLGRDVSDADRKDTPAVVVINDHMARTHWPGEDPIGKRISTYSFPSVTIIGVVKDAAIDRWGASAEDEFYFPFAQTSYATSETPRFANLTLVARVSCAVGKQCDASSFATPVANAVRTLDRNVAISTVATMSSAVASATAESRFYLVLLGAFAAIALALAAVGIYGVMSYSVSRRTHEMGIRIAVGADPMGVVRLVVGEGIRLAGIGAAVGVIAAFGLTRLMSKLLYATAPSDPMTFVLVTLGLCAVGVLASYVPARRATKVDPLTALRAD